MPRKKKSGIKVSYLLPVKTIETIEQIVADSSEYRQKEVWRIKYYHLVDHIIQSTHYERGKVLGKDYINMHSKVMSEVLSVNSGEMSFIFRRLKKHGILKCDNRMQQQVLGWEGVNRKIVVPGKSYGYTLTDTELRHVVIEDQRDFYKSRLHVIDEKSTLQNSDLRNYHNILLSLEINETEWKKAIGKILDTKQSDKDLKKEYRNLLYPSKKLYNDDYIYSPLGGASVPENDELESDETTIARCEHMYLRVKNRCFPVIRNGKSRVHSQVNCLYKELRESLRLNGKPLIGVDIRNSQPLIASLIIREYWMKEHGYIPDDVYLYQQRCEQGIFYDYFMAYFDIPHHLRGEFKKDFFAKVFFSMEYDKVGKLKEIFKQTYPNVWEAIYHLKGGLKKEKYKQFSIQLQHKEAEIIFDEVVVGLIKAGVNVVNIYDAIYVTERAELAMVIKTLRLAFRKRGLNPKFNYENKNALVKGVVGKNSQDFS